jgi:ADP-ribosylglycohydrolase
MTVTGSTRSAVRGSFLGLLLGDAVGAIGGKPPPTGVLPAKCAGQLACFTVDGMIRSNVRSSHKGICHPPSVVWHAYHRWAALQGIPGVKQWRADGWPDGWLADVPVLAERRGNAPATVAALQGQRMGTAEEPAGTSLGAHALTRTLPAGSAAPFLVEPLRFAHEVAATTHAAEAADVAAAGARMVATLVNDALSGSRASISIDRCTFDTRPPLVTTLRAALAARSSDPRNAQKLRLIAANTRASSALAGAIYVVGSFPEREQIRDALVFAASAGDGGHVAAVTGAFLGAAHGVESLPADWISRLELAWVGDVLAQDMITEFTEGPSGSEYAPAGDDLWWNRYPGW